MKAMSPLSNSSISGIAPASRITFAMRRTLRGVLMTTSPPEFMVLRSSVADFGPECRDVADALLRRHQRRAGAGDTRIVFRGNETSAGPGRQVEDQVWPRFAQRLDDLRIVIELHRRTPGLGIADMDVNHGGTDFSGFQRGLDDLRGRDRQMRRLIGLGQIAGDGTGEDDLAFVQCDVTHRSLPPSTTSVVPVAYVRWVAQARIASATSSAAATRFKGIVWLILSLKSAPRPGTKPVSTTPGETPITRIEGGERPRQRFHQRLGAGLRGAIGDVGGPLRCSPRSRK